MEKLRIAITVNVIATYREGFYDALLSRDDIYVKIYCQSHVPGMNFKTIHHKYPNNVKLIKFWSADADKIAWQFLPWREIINNYDVIFISGNPRILSDAIFGTFLRAIGKRVVLWTMAHTYGANPITEKIRLLWSRFFKYLFVYTDSEVTYLQRKGFKNRTIVGMNNGLDQKKIDLASAVWTNQKLEHWRKENSLEDSTMILSCARLDQKNKFDQVLRALKKIVIAIPNIKWCLIGDGIEREKLQLLSKELNVEDHVFFVGGLYNEKELAPWFLSSKLLVHPAAIGLSIMHSFGYGLPLVTHEKTELHGPEYAAFELGLTGANFEIDNIEDLAKVISNLVQDDETLKKMGDFTLQIARNKYNVDVMAERFVQMAKLAASK